MHQALYRKYRPKRFDDVCGEDPVSSVLRYQVQNGRVSHAYLFCGPRGTGKTSCAKILAKAVNCLSPVDGNPCGTCDACRAIDEGTAPDVVEMDAASNNGVDYIRDIRDAVSYTPASLRRRVYIIDEVHMLSNSAFNALLKTLEEPPEHVLFILATTELHKLPATVISRCQRFDFRRIKVDVIADRLLYIAENEGIALEPAAARSLAKQAMGGMRDAISFLELCAGGGHAVTEERVRETLGLSGTEAAYKTAVAVKRRDFAALFRMVDAVVSSSRDIAVFWQEITEFWRNMLLAKYLPPDGLTEYLDLTEPELRVLSDAAKRFDEAALSYHFTVLDGAAREMNRSPATKRLTAELSLLKLCDPTLETSVEALTARIAALENRIALLEGQGNGGAQKVESPLSGEEPSLPMADAAPNAERGAIAPLSADVGADSEKRDLSQAKREDRGALEGIDKRETAEKTLIPLRDTGEIAEKLGVEDPDYRSFFRDADCAVSADRKTVLVRTAGGFAETLLSTEKAKRAILAAFVQTGAASPDAVVTVETGGAPKKRRPVDELAEF